MASSGAHEKYCLHCGLKVKRIPRTDEEAIGRGEIPLYIHDTTRKRSDDPQKCARSNLKEDDVTDENWWGV